MELFAVDIFAALVQSLVIGRKLRMKKAYPKTLNRARIIKLYRAGKNVAEIARLAGYPAGHGNNRVRGLLMKAGAYKAAR
jgi:hypothetical protein